MARSGTRSSGYRVTAVMESCAATSMFGGAVSLWVGPSMYTNEWALILAVSVCMRGGPRVGVVGDR